MTVIHVLNPQLHPAFRQLLESLGVVGFGAIGECRIEMALRVAANIRKLFADSVPLDPCLP